MVDAATKPNHMDWSSKEVQATMRRGIEKSLKINSKDDYKSDFSIDNKGLIVAIGSAFVAVKITDPGYSNFNLMLLSGACCAAVKFPMETINAIVMIGTAGAVYMVGELAINIMIEIDPPIKVALDSMLFTSLDYVV